MVDILTLDNTFKVLEILSIIGGGGFVAFRFGRTTTRFELSIERQNDILRNQSGEINELRIETKKLGDVLTAIAVQSNRMDRVEQDIRELRHGHGFVTNAA